MAFRDSESGVDHVALVFGDVGAGPGRDGGAGAPPGRPTGLDQDGADPDGADPDGADLPGAAPVVVDARVAEQAGAGGVLARLHSECLTGESFASRRCDCGEQLATALRMIAAEGRGVLVYLRGHEGRGIGLGAKIAAYALQDGGHDTLDANLALGLPGDAREYGAGAAILADLGVASVRLMTNNPDKVTALSGHGVEVAARVPLAVPVDPLTVGYLRTKRDRMRHLLPQRLDGDPGPGGTGPATEPVPSPRSDPDRSQRVAGTAGWPADGSAG